MTSQHVAFAASLSALALAAAFPTTADHDARATGLRPEPITYGQMTDVPMPSAFHVFSANLADLTGDGLLDVVAAPATGGALFLLRNIGDAADPRFANGFAEPPLLGSRPHRWTLFDAIEREHRSPHAGDVSEYIGRTFHVADGDGDGRPDVLLSRAGRIAWAYNQGGRPPIWSSPEPVRDSSGAEVTFKDYWYTVNAKAIDWDGDGRLDLLCGVWHPSRYTRRDIRVLEPREVYTESSAHLYWLRNIGRGRTPRYQAPRRIDADTGPLTGLGIPAFDAADLDADGDLDLIVAYYGLSIRRYENVGAAHQPRLQDRGWLEADGERIASADVFRPEPSFADLDRDGDLDLVVAGHGRAVARFENVGTRRELRLARRGYLPMRVGPTTPLHLGNIITPVTIDWDGDGDRDLLAGNEPGIMLWAQNVGTDARPVFASAQYVLDERGRPLELLSKNLSGSMWGPLEDYDERTSPVPVDWDGDGMVDLVTNTMGGRVYWLRNLAVRGERRFSAPMPVETDAGPLVSLPRSRPGIADWNGDRVPDVLVPDAHGVLMLYLGRREGGPLRLDDGRALRTPMNDAIVMNPVLGQVGSGRVQHEVIDWDGDGRLDVVASKREDGERRRYWVAWYRNVGTNEGPVLDGRELIPIVDSGHEAGLHVVDWNQDGVLDVLTGDQEGRVWFWDGRRLPR